VVSVAAHTPYQALTHSALVVRLASASASHHQRRRRWQNKIASAGRKHLILPEQGTLMMI